MLTSVAIQAFEILAGDRASFAYSGSFPDDHTARLIALGDAFMVAGEQRRDFRNRLSFVMVEAYQNIIRHRSHDLDGAQHGARSMFILRCTGGSIQVAAVNPIHHKESGSLLTMLGGLEGLERGQLKELFLRGLQAQGTTKRGGAGLGLIEMARRSGNDLRHALAPLNPDADLFTLGVELGDPPPDASDPLAPISALHALMTKGDLLIVHAGIIGAAAESVVMRALEQETDGAAPAVTRAYLAAMEHLHTATGSERGPLLLIAKQSSGFQILLAQESTEAHAAELGRMLNELAGSDKYTISKRYRDALLQGTRGKGSAGTGILDLARHALGPITHQVKALEHGKALVAMAVPV